jgi:hypothetical protein
MKRKVFMYIVGAVMELTEKQRQFLDYLTERLDEDGRIPTLR